MLISDDRRRHSLFAACALGALLVAAPSGHAASFGDGSADLALSSSFAKRAGKLSATFPAQKQGSRGVSLPIDTNGGTATLTARPSGTLNADEDAGFTLKRGKRSAAFDNCTVGLTGSKARLRCDGRTLFEGSLARDRVKPDAEFTRLAGRVPVKLTGSGAKFLKRKLKSGKRLKRGQKAGSLSVDAERMLTIVSGSSRTFYDTAFYDRLQSCDINLLALAPAEAIPAGAEAPRGGVNLPQRAGGRINAVTRSGSFQHDGGTQLNRPATSPQPPAPYVSDLVNYVFQVGSATNLLADVPRLGLREFNIGRVSGGNLVLSLTDTGGSVSLSGAELVLSDLASGTLKGDTNCDIPPGSKIGTVQTVSNVE